LDRSPTGSYCTKISTGKPGIKAARIVESAQGGQFPGETTGHLPRETRLAQIERRRFLQ